MTYNFIADALNRCATLLDYTFEKKIILDFIVDLFELEVCQYMWVLNSTLNCLVKNTFFLF